MYAYQMGTEPAQESGQRYVNGAPCDAAICQNSLTARVTSGLLHDYNNLWSGSIAEWLACWTQAQKGPGSNRSRDTFG